MALKRMSGAGVCPLLLLYLLSAVTFIEARHGRGRGLDCDPDDCKVGTSVGTGACHVAAIFTGGLASPLCDTADDIYKDGICSKCGVQLEDVVDQLDDLKDTMGEEFDKLENTVLGGFEDIRHGLHDLGDTVVQGIGNLGAGLSHLGGRMNDWFKTLSENDRKLVEGQTKLILMQSQGLAKLETIMDKTEDLSDDSQLAHMLTLYGRDVSNIRKVSKKFSRLNDGKFGIIKNDHRVKVFTDIALDPTDGLESSIDNVFLMMTGGHPMKSESIYEALGKDFCRQEQTEYLMLLLKEALFLYATATAMKGREMSGKLLRDYRQNIIKASQSYDLHCGCQDGYRCASNGVISALIPSLQESKKPVLDNLLAVNNITDPITRNKLLLLNSIKNIDPTDRLKRAVNNVTVEAIELALMKREARQDDDMALYDNQIMCASVTKNGMNLLTANEVRKELADLRSEMYMDLKGKAFDVYRTTKWSKKGNITYEGTAVDTFSGAINLGTGKFIAPEKGVYRFTFTGNLYDPSGKDGYVTLYLKKDDQTIASSHVDPLDASGNPRSTSMISLNSITEMNAGQTVYVECSLSNGAYLHYGSNRYTHFTGELIAKA